MIGFYNYTTLLTYLSLVSAGLGIVISLSGGGHPCIGVFFLLFCGLCDAFEGSVARMTRVRREMDCSFGVQIDSLSDLVAFGVLPACIGVAMLRTSTLVAESRALLSRTLGTAILTVVPTALLVLYILAAMIRLAYFNVTEEERQRTEGGARRYFTGLPVTSAAIIFPTVLLQYLIPEDVTPVYFIMIVLTGLAFLAKFKVKKPGLRGVLILVGIGAVEFLAMLLLRNCFRIR